MAAQHPNGIGGSRKRLPGMLTLAIAVMGGSSEYISWRWYLKLLVT